MSALPDWRHVGTLTVLILCQEWKLKHNSERAGIGRENNQLGYASIESLGDLVGTYRGLSTRPSRASLQRYLYLS
jgi:hypothetical protein